MEGGDNLWSKILKESSKRPVYPDAVCVLVGDANCGKKMLMDKLCLRKNNIEKENFRKEILTYDYFDVDEGLLDGNSRVNVWSFGKHIFNNAQELLSADGKNNRTVFLIAVDLNKGEQCITNLKLWLEKVSSFITSYSSKIQEKDLQNSRNQLLNYIKNARLNNGKILKPVDSDQLSQISDEKIKEQLEFIKIHFGVPIIVVGCKSDVIFQQESNAAIKNMKLLQGHLRAICLEVGATLIYTSAVKETNCAILKRYLMHRLYPEHIPMELLIEDQLENTFIPAGFDSNGIISIATGITITPGAFQQSFTNKEVIETPTDGEEPAPMDEIKKESVVDVESEQDWLNGLEQFISQLTNFSSTKSSIRNSESDNNLLEKHHQEISKTDISVTSAATGKVLGRSSSLIMDVKKEIGLDGKQKQGVSSRRSSAPMKNPQGKSTDKKDVGDFFKNLLEKNPKK